MLTEQEFQKAAERYLDMVYRIALNYFRSPQDAEDAAQETMLRLWRAEVSFTGEEHLRYWLTRVAVNVCRSIARSRRSPIRGKAPCMRRCGRCRPSTGCRCTSITMRGTL